MVNELEDLIEDQLNVEFTGRIQLLNREDFSSLGFILFKEGIIIDARFENKMGERAFISAMLHQERCRMILEPEFIDSEKIITKSYRELIEAYEEALIEHKYYEYFTVPKGVGLKVNPEFLKRGADLTNEEYSVLLSLSKEGYTNLSRHLNLLNYEITKNLISLRRKNALKTFREKQPLKRELQL